MARIAHLVMVTDKNNNKFYDMKEVGDTIQIVYGRVGTRGMKANQHLDGKLYIIKKLKKVISIKPIFIMMKRLRMIPTFQ